MRGLVYMGREEGKEQYDRTPIRIPNDSADFGVDISEIGRWSEIVRRPDLDFDSCSKQGSLVLM